ncbi:MAG: aldehyde dehydrogenase family protein [Elusimicrobia bacterium]|nr:aldehyde dehydrogenase family protein [Elusimicrobiota bacterium]
MTTAVKTVPPPARNISSEEVAQKAAAARSAQALWRRYSLSERVDIIRSLWRQLLSKKAELLRVIHDETGKPFNEIETTELGTVELIVKYFTSNAHRILQDQAAWRPWLLFNKRTYIHYVPRGLVGLVTPWNLPFMIPMGDAFAAMLAGNAVLIKPSEWTTRTALWAADAIKATGLLPEGLFAVAPGDGTVGKQVVELADMILFTGSTRAGKLVGQAAAAELKPAVLELGGKHPMIVLKDAAIDRAAKAAVWASFANCGQMCVGVERVYVEGPAYEPFVDAVRREMSGLRQGLGGVDVDLGRMIFPPQFARVKEQLEEARSKGGRVIGGDVIDEANLMISPALVLEATPEMKVMSEETFGPVMPVMRVESEEEAVRLANSLPFGLAASLWTTDLEKADRLGAQIEAGLLSINDVMSHYALCSLPFGGIKSSGLGRRHSDEGLRMFCWPQSVFVHEWPAKASELWWFPYDDFKTKLVTWISRLA